MGKIMRNGVQYGVDTADVLSTVAECDASASGGKGTTQVASAKALSELNSNFEEELSNSLGGLRFGIDVEGNYGYKEVGADTVIPFSKVFSRIIDKTKRTLIRTVSCEKTATTSDEFTVAEDGIFVCNYLIHHGGNPVTNTVSVKINGKDITPFINYDNEGQMGVFPTQYWGASFIYVSSIKKGDKVNLSMTQTPCGSYQIIPHILSYIIG